MNKVPKFCFYCGAPIKPGEKFCPKCGVQLVKNLYDKTNIQPTNIEPTEIEPTEIKPTEIKPTEIEPTEIKPTEIKPTEIKPTDIQPTPIKPTPIIPGVFNNRFFLFFINPSPFIFGISSLVSSITMMVLIGYNGFKWWISFFALAVLISLFEVVLSFIKTSSVNAAGNKSFLNKCTNWLGIKQTPKTKMVKTIVGTNLGLLSILSLIFALIASSFMKYKNFIVIDGHQFKYEYKGYGYNPETDFEIVEFYPGHKARKWCYADGGVLKFQVSGPYWRIGDECGLHCHDLEGGSWTWAGGTEEWGDTENFEILDATTLRSGSCYYYRIK